MQTRSWTKVLVDRAVYQAHRGQRPLTRQGIAILNVQRGNDAAPTRVDTGLNLYWPKKPYTAGKRY